MIRIAVTGPESTGKTTLSRQLAKKLDGEWVKEYARNFLNQTGGNYREKDLLNIARGQFLQTHHDQISSKYLVSDTELTVIMVWAEDKFGKINPEIRTLWEKEKFDLIFLLYPDIPWEPDPLREDPDRREILFNKYHKLLADKDTPFYVIKGNDKLEKILKLVPLG